LFALIDGRVKFGRASKLRKDVSVLPMAVAEVQA
jgi:ribosomal protein L27